MNKKNRKAFTLVEMIVVIGVILLLFTITATLGTAFYAKSDEKVTKARMEQLKGVIQSYAQEAKSFPADNGLKILYDNRVALPSDLRDAVEDLEYGRGGEILGKGELTGFLDGYGRAIIWERGYLISSGKNRKIDFNVHTKKMGENGDDIIIKVKGN